MTNEERKEFYFAYIKEREELTKRIKELDDKWTELIRNKQHERLQPTGQLQSPGH